MFNYDIQEAKTSDADPIASLWQRIDECTPTRPFGGDTASKIERAKDIISHAIQSSGAHILVAKSNQEIIGTITGHLYERPAVQLSSVGVIYSLWVSPDCRRQGIGQALVDAIEQHLILMGAQAFQVGWDTVNEYAGEWWQKRGYNPYETIASKNV